MKFVQNPDEDAQLLQQEKQIFAIPGLDVNDPNHFLMVNYFNARFDLFFFLRFNNVFVHQKNYNKFIDFIHRIKEKYFVVSGYMRHEAHVSLFKRVLAESNDRFEDYFQHILTRFEDGMAIQDTGIAIWAEYVLVYGGLDVWAMMHDRYKDIIIIGINAEAEQALKDAYGNDLLLIDDVIEIIESEYQSKLSLQTKSNLQAWYGNTL